MFDLLQRVPCSGCGSDITVVIPQDEDEWTDSCWSCAILYNKTTRYHVSRLASGQLIAWEDTSEQPRLYPGKGA